MLIRVSYARAPDGVPMKKIFQVKIYVFFGVICEKKLHKKIAPQKITALGG